MNPALGCGIPDGPVPGATRQADEPVKAYSPLSRGGSAATFVAQLRPKEVATRAATEHINVRRRTGSIR